MAAKELAWIADGAELQQEIITDLAADKWLLRDAQRAVAQTFSADEDYSANYARALQKLKYWKHSGGEVTVTARKLRQAEIIRKIKVGALQKATSPSIASDARGKAVYTAPSPNAEEKIQPQPSLPRAADPAEGAAKDRAHIPTHGDGLTAVAPTAQTSTQKETPMAKLCKCGCGQALKPDSTREYKMNHKPALVKEPRLCACGCGGKLNNRHSYIKGHKENPPPKVNSLPPVALQSDPPAPSNGHSNGAEKNHVHARAPEIRVHIDPPKLEPNGLNGHTAHSMRAAVVVNCDVTEYAMDLIWSRMLPQDKARLLFPPAESAS